MNTSRHSLDSLLSPESRSTFFSDYWERAPLVLQRREPAYYAALLGSEDLDYIIASACALQRSSIELIRDGDITTGVQDERPGAIYEAYREGHTVRVKGVQRLWPELWHLCRTLQQDFGCPVRANLYCTPANAAGTRQHYDCHDVFVVQIAGRKRWRFDDSAPSLPLQYLPALAFERTESLYSLRGRAPQHDAADAQSEPSREVLLETGDSLYLPRGLSHQVWTEDSASAHVTIGIYAITMVDLMAVALGQVAKQDIRFRKSVPVGATAGLVTPAIPVIPVIPVINDALRDRFDDLLAVFSERANVKTALDEVTGSFVAAMQAFGDGALMESIDFTALTPDAEVQWRPGTTFRLTTLDGSVALASCDASVTVPESLGAPMRFVAEHSRFQIKDLPGGLSPRSKVALVRQLIEKKILSVCAEQETDAWARVTEGIG